MGNALLPAALSKGKKEVVSEVWELRCPYCVPTREIKNLPKTRSRFRKWFEKNPAPSPATEEVSVGPSIRNQLWEGFVTSHGRPGGSAAIPLRTGTGVRNPAYVLAWRTELETRCGGGGEGCSHRMQKVICTSVLAPPAPADRGHSSLVVCVRYSEVWLSLSLC